MRCFPRKSRHQWVFFLLMVCLLGVYLTYRRLVDSENIPSKLQPTHPKQNFEELKQKLDKQVKEELSSGKKVAEIGTKIGNLDVLPENPQNDLIADVAVGRVLDNEEDYVSTEEKYARLKLLLLQLSPSDWKTATDPDEIILLTKSELMDLNIDSKMSCREIDSLKGNNRNQGYHGKKYVDYMKQDYKHEFVVKSVGNDHQLKIDCLKTDFNPDRCPLMANYKLVKELVLLLVLDHPTLIKLHGFCLRGDTIDIRIPKRGVLLVTEAGKQAQQETFTMLPWNSRLEVAINALKLLQYLEASPIGSLGFAQMHLPDFVLVDGDIRLVDLDNINIGEPTCSHDNDCKIKEMPNKEIKCVQSLCQGYNAAKNLWIMKHALLGALFRVCPKPVKMEVEQFLSQINELKVTQAETLNWLQRLLVKAENINGDQMLRVRDDEHYDRVKDRNKPATQKPKSKEPNQVLKFENRGEADGSYEKLPNANLPGRYDYHCTRSRVSWGCVLTVYGLDEAKRFCDEDDVCEAFIVFSQHPETDAMMTMVKKNGFDNSHEMNYGATVYHKRRRSKNDNQRDNANGREENQGAYKGENQAGESNVRQEGETKVKQSSSGGVESCMKKVLNYTESARTRREKRLLTHLGLRDVTEREWLTYAQTVRISKNLGMSPLTTDGVRGGRIKFEFSANAIKLKKGEYIMEYGPKNYHVAFLATYYLDRILGLYHVPPVMARSLSKMEYSNIVGNSEAMDRLVDATDKDGDWLQGLVTVAIPPVMKTEKLTISNLDNIVNTVPEFTRTQKVHLEYILLWELTKMMQPKHGYLGYKGHLIHFEADLAFASLSKSRTGYFYNCQFPNTVFKTLNCYRCSDKRKICGLGEEVMKRVRGSGFMDTEIVLGPLTTYDMIQVIDSSATVILQVVEHCIKTFSRDQVIY